MASDYGPLTPHIKMVTFNIAGFLADFTNGQSEISVNSSPTTVAEALHELWQLHIGLRDRVVNEQGQLRTHVNIFVDGETSAASNSSTRPSPGERKSPSCPL